MNRRFLLLLFVSVILFGPPKAPAEIHNCDGKWTNKPCPGGASVTLKEQVYTPSPLLPSNKEANKEQEQSRAASRSPCPSGQTLITTRPEPKADWVTNQTPRGTQESQVVIEGNVEGHGKVGLEIIGSGHIQGAQRQREKVLYSSTLTLPLSGGSQRFHTSFSIPAGWVWNVRAENKGAFPGYCSSRAQ